jgi:hypothetical protein
MLADALWVKEKAACGRKFQQKGGWCSPSAIALSYSCLLRVASVSFGTRYNGNARRPCWDFGKGFVVSHGTWNIDFTGKMSEV